MITPAAVLSSILPSSGATLLEPTALNGLMSGDTITQKMRFMTYIPEPSTYGILIGALLLVVVMLRRQKKISQ